MEIKAYSSVVNTYRFNADSAAEKNSKSRKAEISLLNTDKADFSAAPKASFADSLKAAARTAAEKNASSDTLSALREKIGNGEYNIAAEDIAASILGF